MTGARLQGEESWSIPLQELFPGKRIALWCHLSPVVQAHKVHCCFYFPQPCLNHRNAGNRTGCSLGTVFTKPPVQSPIQIFGSQASGPPAGATESAQTPAPPPHACTCTHIHILTHTLPNSCSQFTDRMRKPRGLLYFRIKR